VATVSACARRVDVAQWDEEYLRQRAEEVGYSTQILYQELRARGYRGSYETVKLFVRPLRTRASSAEQTLKRFETAPGHQSQIDWGQARVFFGGRGDRPPVCADAGLQPAQLLPRLSE
jgi:transposase